MKKCLSIICAISAIMAVATLCSAETPNNTPDEKNSVGGRRSFMTVIHHLNGYFCGYFTEDGRYVQIQFNPMNRRANNTDLRNSEDNSEANTPIQSQESGEFGMRGFTFTTVPNTSNYQYGVIITPNGTQNSFNNTVVHNPANIDNDAQSSASNNNVYTQNNDTQSSEFDINDNLTNNDVIPSVFNTSNESSVFNNQAL